jgi:hypothetical protein
LSDPGWWEHTAGTALEQGDLLLDIPIYSTRGAASDPHVVQVETELADVVVVTQTCDLDNDKVDRILVAGAQPWRVFAGNQYAAGNTGVKSSGFHQNLVRGNIPALTLLAAAGNTIPTIDWTIVDFRDLAVIQRVDIDAHTRRTTSRLRLRSPYKEHFAQAFARYFMRVGLPLDAEGFLPYALTAFSI